VVTKGCVSAFIGTNLQSKLIANAAEELVLGGVATNQVVESTARIAADMGYRVTVLEDLCASFDADMHAFSVEQMLPNFGRVTDSRAYLEELS
jgi:nicotinamidase-related amidase